MKKKKDERVLWIVLGGLRTAYPFCCGSRHHSDWPNGPCWLIRMFQSKWSLIQSTVFPWAREWAGRAHTPSIIYSNSRFLLGPRRANGTAPELLCSARRGRTQPSLPGRTQSRGFTRNHKTLTRHVAFENSLLSPSLSHL